MALTESNPFPLGTKAPGFHLLDVTTDRMVTLDELKSVKATVIMFICNHCPYVKHINEGLVKLADRYIPKGVSFIAISSNDAEKYPEDAPDKMRLLAIEQKYPFPYLYDDTQEVARAYDAACTPEFYVFDGDMTLVYHGQMDDSRPSTNIPVTGQDLARVMDLVLSGEKVPEDQKPGVGCSIKWK